MVVNFLFTHLFVCLFFFQAEDGIRDAQESRGLGDVYKRQLRGCNHFGGKPGLWVGSSPARNTYLEHIEKGFRGFQKRF